MPPASRLSSLRGADLRELHATGSVVGLNRLGFGPLEVRRHHFTARLARSLFGDREVIFLYRSRTMN